MIRMKVIQTNSAGNPLMFECQEDGCGDIVQGTRLNKHAQQVHQCDEVLVDASLGFHERSRQRKNPICEDCGHSSWFHDESGRCSRCTLHDVGMSTSSERG